MEVFMRKKSKKTIIVKRAYNKKPKKIDGRSKEGKAAKAKLLAKGSAKRKVESAGEVRVKRKYTRKSEVPNIPETKFEKATLAKLELYTSMEFDQAKSYFNNTKSEVRNTIERALKTTPRLDWPKKTFVSVNNRMDTLNTEAVAAVLGV